MDIDELRKFLEEQLKGATEDVKRSAETGSGSYNHGFDVGYAMALQRILDKITAEDNG